MKKDETNYFDSMPLSTSNENWKRMMTNWPAFWVEPKLFPLLLHSHAFFLRWLFMLYRN